MVHYVSVNQGDVKGYFVAYSYNDTVCGTPLSSSPQNIYYVNGCSAHQAYTYSAKQPVLPSNGAYYS